MGWVRQSKKRESKKIKMSKEVTLLKGLNTISRYEIFAGFRAGRRKKDAKD